MCSPRLTWTIPAAPPEAQTSAIRPRAWVLRILTSDRSDHHFLPGEGRPLAEVSERVGSQVKNGHSFPPQESQICRHRMTPDTLSTLTESAEICPVGAVNECRFLFDLRFPIPRGSWCP